MFTVSDCLRKYFLFCSFYFLQHFSVLDTDSLISFALKTCATSSPYVDAFFQLRIFFRILYIVKFELFELHSKVCSFERMLKFNQVCLSLSTCVARC